MFDIYDLFQSHPIIMISIFNDKRGQEMEESHKNLLFILFIF